MALIARLGCASTPEQIVGAAMEGVRRGPAAPVQPSWLHSLAEAPLSCGLLAQRLVEPVPAHHDVYHTRCAGMTRLNRVPRENREAVR